MPRPTFVRGALFLATVAAIWGVFSLGSGGAALQLEVGQAAPTTYVAERPGTVVDELATEAARQAARDAVPDIREVDVEVEGVVGQLISQVFEDAREVVVAAAPSATAYVPPELPEASPPGEGEEPASTVIFGRVYLDVDGDGLFNPDAEGPVVDQGLSRVMVYVETAEGVTQVRTGSDGSFQAEVDSIAAVVYVDHTDEAIPHGWFLVPDGFAVAVVCGAEASCFAGDIGVAPNLRPLDEAEEELEVRQPALPLQPTIAYLVSTASEDVVRAALGEEERLSSVEEAAINRMLQEFGRTIESADLPVVQARVRGSHTPVFHGGAQDPAGGAAAAEIVATFLQPNYPINRERTDEAREEAANAVVPVTVSFLAGETIVAQGVRVTQLHIDAIRETSSTLSTEPASVALLAVIAVMVGVIGLYLSRFRSEIWSRPRMVALLGITLLLAAASIRATVALQPSTSWYLLPAVAFGFITAVLFDQRIALLISLAVGVLTALGTVDVGITVYAVLAAMAPIPFVSSVSSRGDFRNAVVYASLAAATIAAATASFFHLGPNDVFVEVVGQSVMWAFAASIVASLVGLAGLQFFESAFDVTTTLGLLDLTDRNHQALQLLQEEAFGTFNHSLMVGTLAHAAARAIGANPLLARAMAYYHDLGKTENPTYFIENQFGIQNPHDLLEPKESAEVIRSHVTSGVALARRFKIPTEVVQGIVSHHGDGVMRYFYEKARSQAGDGEVNIDDFRHIGHKPRTAETAILMLADSLEAACRAEFQKAEPTPDAIEKVANRIIDEKVEDGQLSESPLTLGELTQIRKAFVDSLVGHYHQRIAYPNFPGS